jgi:uncharacterized protein YyaL (SSP411 family)
LQCFYASLDEKYLENAQLLTKTAVTEFFDFENGGFYLYGSSEKELIARPKETYDGAVPSGNSVMTMNLALLNLLSGREFDAVLTKQTEFMNAKAAEAPHGHSFYLFSLLEKDFRAKKITAVLTSPSEKESVKPRLRGKGWVTFCNRENEEFSLKNGKTTFYICENNACKPPVNEL